MVRLNMDPWEDGVLDETVHARMVTRIADVAKDAGIPAPYIWTKLDLVCQTEAEQTWLKRFKYHRLEGNAGLVYFGRFDPTVEERCFALAGALTRNFIRARVFPMDVVFDYMRQGDAPEATCLILPTFTDDREKSEAWKKPLVSDLLLSRFMAMEKQTVICAPSLAAIEKSYGTSVADHVRAHYLPIQGAVK